MDKCPTANKCAVSTKGCTVPPIYSLWQRQLSKSTWSDGAPLWQESGMRMPGQVTEAYILSDGEKWAKLHTLPRLPWAPRAERSPLWVLLFWMRTLMFSSFNPVTFPFKLLVPFIWSHEGVWVGTVLGSVIRPFPPLVEGPLVHHHVASLWPTLSRWREQQGPQEAVSWYSVKLHGHR